MIRAMTEVARDGWSALTPAQERRFDEGVARAERFFIGTSRVQQAMRKLCAALEADGIPYAVAGAMALNAHGCERVTSDIALLLTRQGLEAFKQRHLGLGYLERFPGSKGLRDTEHNVSIDVLIAGDYPGDGKPKPVRFPDPSIAAQEHGLRVLPLKDLVELKLASGLSAEHRGKDLVDVQELIRIVDLPLALAESLDASVRDEYRRRWEFAQLAKRDEY